MADNAELNAGSGGIKLAIASLTFSGDIAGVQVVGCGILSGSEGSWTVSQFVGGAGAVAAGVQRVTLASDDPLVVDAAAIEVLLTTIDADTGAIKTAVELLDNAINGSEMQVDLVGIGGVATESTLSTIAGYLDTEVAALVTAVQLLDNCISGNEAQVDVVSSALPSGAATAANQTTANSSLSTIAGDTTSLDGKVTACNTGAVVVSSGAVTETNSGAIKTAVELIDNAISGTEMQVDVVAALPAGSNAIGKLAANTGVDIGDVDVTSVVPGTGATNLGKARASALGATDTGVAMLAVRNDDLADLAGADGDYTPLQVDPEGALYVTEAKAELKSASGVAAGGAPGTDNMIAAVVGKKLKVVALSLLATSTTINSVYVDNADNDLLGNSGNGIALSLDADGDTIPGIVMPYNPAGWFTTDTVNEAVTLNTSTAQDIIWSISWIETD